MPTEESTLPSDTLPTEIPTSEPIVSTDVPVEVANPSNVVSINDTTYEIVNISIFRGMDRTSVTNQLKNMNMCVTTEGGFVLCIREDDYQNPLMVKKINNEKELKHYIWDIYKDFDFVNMGRIYDKYKEVLSFHFEPTSYITLKF